jgi:polyhydroxybutyrate depolymerase
MSLSLTLVRPLGIVAGMALLLCGARPTAAKAKPAPCAGGRFVVQEPLLTGSPLTQVDVVELTVGGGALSFGCTAADLKAPVRLRAGKKFTRVKAVWHHCAGFAGNVRLAGAKIVDACSTLTGKLKAKGVKTSFTARLSKCDDGFVDTGGGEECETGQTCAGGGACASCLCPPTTTTTTSTSTTTTLPGDLTSRPYASVVPPSYQPGTPTPLLVMLHGYGANAALEDFYLGLTAAANAKGFLYALPDGTLDGFGKDFWNATDACCNFGNLPVDDVAYVSAIIDDMSAKYTVDPKRVFVLGHSNGAFMAYRLACDLASKVVGIVSLAGATWSDVTKCQPALPVSVLEIHGTSDETIAYAGGSILVPFPSAATSVATWAGYDGCSPAIDTTQPPLDLERNLPGAETTIGAYSGCQASTAVELWSVQGGGHIPGFVPAWFDPVYDFLMAHPRP